MYPKTWEYWMEFGELIQPGPRKGLEPASGSKFSHFSFLLLSRCLRQSPPYRLAFLAHWFTQYRETPIASPCLHLSIQWLVQGKLKFFIQFPDPRRGNLICPPCVKRPPIIQSIATGQVRGWWSQVLQTWFLGPILTNKGAVSVGGGGIFVTWQRPQKVPILHCRRFS